MKKAKIKIEYVSIKEVKSNPNNPRVIRDDKFANLVKSIEEDSWMSEARPIVVDENMVAQGGNQRFRAYQHLGWKEVPVMKIDSEVADEKAMRRFVIKDNVHSGEYDWEVLANEYDPAFLKEMGVDVWMPEQDVNLDGFFDEPGEEEEKDLEPATNLILTYTEEELAVVKEGLLHVASSYEDAVWKLLKNHLGK